ncbi:FemAB family XrtA/PEP-CTERM system-associated protein [Sphingosinicella sp. YJ22]|uniref:FemAB family XrtA/PEP-CTERM system-associated protein n=1 Tax=Sphingosinicella sp. YJ22 TaxID=1104780 RepID=UPI00140DCE78|nr:FemAB family XrtA/PEP-CTERM system-associated protein [Sphingosinicella sp. YJ22]
MNAPAHIARVAVRSVDLGDSIVADRVEAFVRGHGGGTPFHLPQWSRAVTAGAGHASHYLVAEQGPALVGVLPLTEVRSLLFGRALVSVGFGVGGGILALGAEAEAALAEAARALAEENGCAGIELRGGTLPHGWHRHQGVYADFARSLPQDDSAILSSIPRKQRAEVRRAFGNDLSVAIDADLTDHYRVYAESVHNLGTPVFPRRLFEAMLDAFGEDADILVVRSGGKPLSAVLSLYMNGTVYPYWGGGTFAARSARANELLYFELMKHAAARGCTRFDFGRSKLGTGAYAFKKNWGFDPTPLTYASWGEARDTNPLDPRYARKVAAWKRLPLWAANLIGPPIARGLA